jgi:hypothetical protein
MEGDDGRSESEAADRSGGRPGRNRFFAPGQFVGGGDTRRLEIVRIEPHHGGPFAHDPDNIHLMVDLRPSPPSYERWWWRKRIMGDRSHYGGSESDDVLNIQFDMSRSRLEETVRELRSNLAGANRDYPDAYFSDSHAVVAARAAREATQRQQVEAEQALIDRVMQEDLDLPS